MKLQNCIDDLLESDPFKITSFQKQEYLLNIIKLQIEHHLKHCIEYRNWFNNNSLVSPKYIRKYEDIPFIPSSVFKYLNLNSISNKKTKTIMSSGTSNQIKSKINIDSITSTNQRKCLSKILASILGKDRKIFYILDAEPQNGNGSEINARIAGMQGYMLAAKSIKYLLINKNNKLIFNKSLLMEIKNNINNTNIVLIGYTFMFWKYLINNEDIEIKKYFFKNKFKLIHFGGWKKLSNLKISKNEFNKKVIKRLQINSKNIFDIYGFTEQLGTIYPAQGYENCRVSAFSHILVRDPNTLNVLPDGKEGFLQFISPLPLSYPGFSLLNDDIGVISKRKKDRNNFEDIQFQVYPRLNKAVSRGCGDTLPDTYYI